MFDCVVIVYVKRISELWISTSFFGLISMSSVIADVDTFDDAMISELEKFPDEQDDMAHDSIISELEKPSDEQDDMAHGSEPLRKKMKGDEAVEVAVPKTPEISALKTPPIRHQTHPQSPWAQQKVVIPSKGDKKATIMQSKPQRASAVALKTGQWKACEAVEKIWSCMKVAMTTCILVLGWQTEPTCSTYNGTLCYHAWGLSETNLWVRIACWGLFASFCSLTFEDYVRAVFVFVWLCHFQQSQA